MQTYTRIHNTTCVPCISVDTSSYVYMYVYLPRYTCVYVCTRAHLSSPELPHVCYARSKTKLVEGKKKKKKEFFIL